MLELIQNEILFYASIIFLMFLPGWLLLSWLFRLSDQISSLEKFILSFGLSVVILDFMLFSYAGAHILITRWSIILGMGIINLLLVIFYKIKPANDPLFGKSEQSAKQSVPADCSLPSGPSANDSSNNLFNFSRNQFILILLLLFTTVFLKTHYLSGTITPTATDMGHHLYWAKWMAVNHQLPDYEGMPDFIIGEHTVFGSIYLLTNLSFTSGWPVVILYLINLLSILIMFVLAIRIFNNRTIGILVILFLGVVFAISSPQSKFVSGGVIGNIFGNYLLPLALYFYYRAIKHSLPYPLLLDKEKVDRVHPSGRETDEVEEKMRYHAKNFLTLAIFTTFGLFYTHHLTSFIFLFVFLLVLVLFFLTNYKKTKEIIKSASKIIFTPPVLGTFIIGLIFFFLIFTPTYVNPKAIDTAVGTPVKATRIGMTFSEIRSTVGESRTVLGLLGLLILFISYKKINFGYAIIAAWTIMIFVMSMAPELLLIDLPNNRVGNYLTYPLSILSAYGLYTIFRPDTCQLVFTRLNVKNSLCLVTNNLFRAVFLIIFTFVVSSGLYDSVAAFKNSSNINSASQTFHVSDYLAARTNEKDNILKDHNYLTADSWMKLSFMRGYKYPDSRGYFKRYEDQTKPREMCTMYMISNPGGKEAKDCFSDTGTDFLIVNPKYDAGQFRRLPEFNQIYANNEVMVFYKKRPE